AEIFLREGPSKEAEAMQNWLLDSLYDTQVKRIATSRKVSPELVKAWIDSGPHSAEKAKELGMVDAVEHRQDLEARLKQQFGSDIVFDRNKLGVAFKSYRRGQNAGMLASSEVFTPGERLKLRSWMDEIYGVFKGHVTAIRGNRLKKPIDDLAGGRVYTGKQAL